MNTPASSIDDELERHPTAEMPTIALELARLSDDIKNYRTQISKLESVQEKKLSQLSARITKLQAIRQKWQFPSSTECQELLEFLFYCIVASVLAVVLM
jgi:hypothetical protein